MQSLIERSRTCAQLFTVALSGLLGACGGGAGGNTEFTNPITGTLGGVAAVGAPIADGLVTVICASGSVVLTRTGPAGAWQIGLREQALPCAVQVSGGAIGSAANGIAYHSIGIAKGNVNLTPLTDLMVANLTGSATPDTWFSGLAASRSSVAAITSARVTATWLKLRDAWPELTALATIHPMATSFEASPGNSSDDMLAALQMAMDSSHVSYASLLGDAAIPAFRAPPHNFSAALSQAYASLTTP